MSVKIYQPKRRKNLELLNLIKCRFDNPEPRNHVVLNFTLMAIEPYGVELITAGYLVITRATDSKVRWTSVTGEAEVCDARSVLNLTCIKG